MGAVVKVDVCDAWKHPVGTSKPVLSPKQERRLLEELAECRRTLATALARDPKQVIPEKTDDPRMMSRFIAEAYRNQGPADSALKAVFQRYFELRAELALANMRLVAHVAKRYRDRESPTPTSSRKGSAAFSRRSTGSTWLTRRSCPLTRPGGFARPSSPLSPSGAYPVRLAPRHLRQLAQNQDQLDPTVSQEPGRPHATTELVQRIHAAVQPLVSLDETRLSTRHTTSTPKQDRTDDLELDEAVGKWMVSLRPRERQVLSYRFGLGGSPRLSLSQVGEVLNVSKERVRQIQDAALKVLRTNASRDKLIETSRKK